MGVGVPRQYQRFRAICQKCQALDTSMPHPCASSCCETPSGAGNIRIGGRDGGTGRWKNAAMLRATMWTKGLGFCPTLYAMWFQSTWVMRCGSTATGSINLAYIFALEKMEEHIGIQSLGVCSKAMQHLFSSATWKSTVSTPARSRATSAPRRGAARSNAPTWTFGRRSHFRRSRRNSDDRTT